MVTLAKSWKSGVDFWQTEETSPRIFWDEGMGLKQGLFASFKQNALQLTALSS